MPRRYSMENRAAATEATRARLIAAALEVVAVSGADGLTTQAVADTADVALRTLYNHFATKEELVGQAMAELLDDTRAAVRDIVPLAGTPRDRLLGFVDAYYLSYHRQGIAAAALLRAQGIPEVERVVTQIRTWRRQELTKLLRAIEDTEGLRAPLREAVALSYALTAYAAWSALVNDNQVSSDTARRLARHTVETALLVQDSGPRLAPTTRRGGRGSSDGGKSR